MSTKRTAPPSRVLVAVLILVLLVMSGCAASPGAAEVRFDPVDLPGGAVPEVLTAVGDELLVGVRYGTPTARPGLLRLGPGGSPPAEVPLQAATGYGRTASWYSLTSDGRQVLGIGGDRGGAHGNVRWSVWSGSDTGVQEQPQAFSTFGGWGAGDLVDAVLTPTGAAVVGSWQSADAGLDVAVWTADGDTWSRTDSTGTPLQSTRGALGFATSATGYSRGMLVVGWQVISGRAGPVPVVWQSESAATGWTRTSLPDSGSAGSATAVRCAEAVCVVAGWVDGALALWRLSAGSWSRVPGLPVIRVGSNDPLPAPLNPAGSPTQLASGGGRVQVVTVDAARTMVRSAQGPNGTVTSAVDVGGSVYLLAGPDIRTLRLWRADTAALR
jgi:hypothetical protein